MNRVLFERASLNSVNTRDIGRNIFKQHEKNVGEINK